jgi:hypothetical protein
MGIKQHLVRLQRVSPDQKRPAVRQLDMRDLKLQPLAANIGPVFTPIKLESFTRLENQRHESAAPCRLFRPLSVRTPCTGKSRHTLVGTIIPQMHQVRVHLFDGSTLLARFARLRQQPRRQPIRIGVQLGRSRRRLELRLNSALAQILLHRVPR